MTTHLVWSEADIFSGVGEVRVARQRRTPEGVVDLKYAAVWMLPLLRY